MLGFASSPFQESRALLFDPFGNPNRAYNADRWPSGRRRTPGKCVGGRPSPGFESLSVRQFSVLLYYEAFRVFCYV